MNVDKTMSHPYAVIEHTVKHLMLFRKALSLCEEDIKKIDDFINEVGAKEMARLDKMSNIAILSEMTTVTLEKLGMKCVMSEAELLELLKGGDE